MSKIYRIKKFDDREKMDFTEWLEYYQENTGIFWAILRQRVRVTRYSLEYGNELEDLMQDSLERVFQQFDREKTIPSLYKHSIFRQAVRNSINIHIRKSNLFRGLPAMGIPQEYVSESFADIAARILALLAGEEVEPKKEVYRQTKTGESKKDYFAGDGERVMTTSMDYLSIDLKIDVSLALTKEENKIVKMLLLKYTRPEIAKIIGVNERTVYRKIANIRQKLENAGIRECAR